MTGLREFIIPYIISQIAAIAILTTSFYSTRWTRALFTALFLWAACINMYLGITNPGSYLGNAKFAIPLYRDFINGWFSHHHYIMIPVIACAQFLIAAGMLLKGWWVKWACTGAIVFLLSIAPLMVASAFPFSLIAAAAAVMILKKDDLNFIWLKRKKNIH